mgnify:CR=1 FL=1
MTEKKLTGNEMFEMVKEECERILGKVENEIDKKQEGVLYKSKRYGKWKWYKTGNEDTDYKYVGEIKNGKPNGRGVSTSTFYPGKKMEGEWKDGELHGQGTETVPYGGKYVGEYKNGRFHVQGTYTWSNGEKYVGGQQALLWLWPSPAVTTLLSTTDRGVNGFSTRQCPGHP